MFIARLVKKYIACVQSMNCDNLFTDSCPRVFAVTSRLLVHFASVRETLSCGQVCVLQVTKCLCVQCLRPSDALFLCERDSVISVCQTWHVLSSSLHLFNDPDIATEHMYCTVGQTLSSHGQGPALLTKPLCMWSSAQIRLYHLRVWSLQSRAREEMKMPSIFAPFSAPCWDCGGLFKARCLCMAVSQEGRRSRGRMYQPVTKLSQM